MFSSYFNFYKKLIFAAITIAGLFLIIASGGSGSSGGGDDNPSGGGGNTSDLTIKITSPEDNSSYNLGQTATFTAQVTPSDDEIIKTFSWSSSIDGKFGVQSSVNKQLSLGKHVITFSATNGAGSTFSEKVNVEIKQTNNTSPIPSITKPQANSTFNAGDLIQFEGHAMDAEDGNIPDSNLKWYSSIDGEIGVGSTFSKNNLSGGKHSISLNARDSQNATATSSPVSITIKNTRPTASISFPKDGATYALKETILFNGEGSDPEDGDLDGESLVWRSSIYGNFGTGREKTVAYFPVGTHKITLTVKDKNGAVDTAQISITIN